jgi:uncharacterized membrane protein YsdA (DUF1294 family)
MLDRLKRALVDSYVGAIALGWLLAQDILHFVGIFGAPVGAWVSQNTYRAMTQKSTGAEGFPFEAAFPELVRTFLLLLIWFALFRWLYLKPSRLNSPKPAPNVESPTQGTNS